MLGHSNCAAIEATVDRRSGITPSEKIWWRRNKLERDVAVVFLLDMSASTAEAIDEGRHAGAHAPHSDGASTPTDEPLGDEACCIPVQV